MLYANVTIVPDESCPLNTRINVFSELNDWMDYDFVVSACREEDAMAVLQSAFNAWHEDNDPMLTMFESLERALIDSGIPFESRINYVD